MIAVGQRVRVVLSGNPELDGRVVVIRAFCDFPDLPDVPAWPCFEDCGELWPLNPEWLAATTASASQDAAQLPLFGASA